MSAADANRTRQIAQRERMDAIMGLSEATGRHNAAFALAIRGDIPVGRAQALLADAPEMACIEEVKSWADAVSARPVLRIVR